MRRLWEGEFLATELNLGSATQMNIDNSSLDRAAGRLGCSFAGREDLEELLLEGLDSGASRQMTAARKKQIYKQALKES